MFSTVDLHIHTLYSDGRDAPEAVLRRAAALGIKTVAITDHDNTNGVRQVQALARELGLWLIPAIELTCRWDLCRSAPGEGDIDVLGYWVDLDDAVFCAFERAALEDIHERVSACCACLTVDGYPILVAILAHPTAIECDGRWLQEVQVAALVEMGLDGLEIYHPRLDREARAYFCTLAQRFDLLVSGGSDAHGWFDEWKGLGTQPVTEAMVAAIQARHDRRRRR